MINIDFFFFNSQISKHIFSKFLKFNKNCSVILITNSEIKNHADLINKSNYEKLDLKKFNIGYIGPYEKYKGFFEFLKLPSILSSKNKYYIFGDDKNIKLPRDVINGGKFLHTNIGEVFELIDVLIVPSIWYETFGFVTIEALSYGVKVIASENVGAKDLINAKFIFKDINDIPNCINKLNNYKIDFQKTMEQHYFEIQDIYLKLLNL